MIIIKRLISPLAALGALICAPLALGQTGTSVDQGDWPYYHGSETSLRYSPLDQINAENVTDLVVPSHPVD